MNILPFSVAAASSGPTLYLAIMGEPEGGFLSPRVMEWSSDSGEKCFLLDMSPTLRYWQQQATERNLTLEELLTSLLPSMSTGVLANHPWQAVLHLKTLSARGNRQLINIHSAFGRNLSRDLSWDAWWKTCHEIAVHWNACGRKSDTLVRNLHSMSQTVQRMQVASPAHFLDKNQDKDKKTTTTASFANQMQRRFGVLLAVLWNWTWSDSKDTTDTAVAGTCLRRSESRREEAEKRSLPRVNEHFPATSNAESGLLKQVLKDEFPWRFIKHKETPAVQRLLEHPLREWEHIEPLLCEDLDRICNLKCWSASERVVSLEWVLSFSNSPTLTIPVLFRHPHCLHREATHHKTALLQAFYSWKSVLERRLKQSHFKADSEYLDNDTVTEWTLKVHERLIIPPHARSLFMDDLNSPSQRLRELENTLPCSLDRFDLTADWTPQDSWTTVQAEETPPFESLSMASFGAQHLRRPLFIYPEPKPLQSKRSSGLVFQERVMRKWWELSPEQPPSIQNAMRDYYLRCEDDGVLQWAFCDPTGKFFLHGVYG